MNYINTTTIGRTLCFGFFGFEQPKQRSSNPSPFSHFHSAHDTGVSVFIAQAFVSGAQNGQRKKKKHITFSSLFAIYSEICYEKLPTIGDICIFV